MLVQTFGQDLWIGVRVLIKDATIQAINLRFRGITDK
jgi:hypothetical protein